MIDPAWVAAGVGVAGTLGAYLKVASSAKENAARIETMVEALRQRAEKRSGEIDEATAQIVALGGRMARAEQDIMEMKDDIRQTRDVALEIRARLS